MPFRTTMRKCPFYKVFAGPVPAYFIAEMAKHAKMSESYFTALFRSVVGLPPYAYLSKCRLDMARTRLAKTTASVAVIAHDLGFASPQHLATQFRKTFGLTPTEWRRQPNGQAAATKIA